MKDTLITYKTAKLAKEKGFNVPVLHSYESNDTIVDLDDTHDWEALNMFEDLFNDYNNDALFRYINYSAPTQSLLQKWLREVHQLDVLVEPIVIGYTQTITNRKTVTKIKIEGNNVFEHYEEALEAGLVQALNLIN